jgi:hypothetical protein
MFLLLSSPLFDGRRRINNSRVEGYSGLYNPREAEIRPSLHVSRISIFFFLYEAPARTRKLRLIVS